MQVNPKDKANLVLIDDLGNVHVPLVSFNSPEIPLWNKQGEDWIISIFDFIENFLTFDGAMFFFHLNDPLVLKEIRSYLESYSFQICVKWAIVNSFPLVSSRGPFFEGMGSLI